MTKEESVEEMEKIESFEILTLHTSGMRCVADWEITREGDRAVLTRYDLRYADGKDVRIPEEAVPCETAEVLEVLNRCRLLEWDGFCGPHPRGVLDGEMFRLKAVVNGGETVEASGSANFPRGYRDLTDWLYETVRRREGQD